MNNAAQSINPATGELLNTWPYVTAAQAEVQLQAAHTALNFWGKVKIGQRADVLRAIARELRARKPALARMVTLEMGKPITEAEAEVDKSAWNCEYVADQGPQWLADQVIATSARDSRVVFRPLGVILSITPWNFPLWQVFRGAASALMAGNTLLLKHAPSVQGCAAAIADLIRSAGLPEGVFQNLNAPVEIIPALIADSRVAAVTLTGSPAAGGKVAALAGASCKKSILELGGSDAFIVLADADLDAAVAAGVRARFTNCGQVCLAAKRFFIEAPIASTFAERFTAAAQALRRGDPLDRDTQLGPMARADLRDELQLQVATSVAAGARIMAGAKPANGAGWYYEPTVLADVTPTMPVYARETFGPVAALVTVPDVQSAIMAANDTPFGLSTMLWTQDLQRATALAGQLQVGSVFVNSVTASDPRLPVGGVKLSGYGRELGEIGMRELTNPQTVWTG